MNPPLIGQSSLWWDWGLNHRPLGPVIVPSILGINDRTTHPRGPMIVPSTLRTNDRTTDLTVSVIVPRSCERRNPSIPRDMIRSTFPFADQSEPDLCFAPIPAAHIGSIPNQRPWVPTLGRSLIRNAAPARQAEQHIVFCTRAEIVWMGL